MVTFAQRIDAGLVSAPPLAVPRRSVSTKATIRSEGLAAPGRPFESDGDEAALIARCAAGDRAALGELYRRHKAEAMRYIRHAARHTQDAEDILQEVFVEVSRSLGRFEGRSAFNTWLHRICVRTAVRHQRRRHRQLGEPAPEIKAQTEAAERGPDASAEQRERARRVAAMLEQIAPKKRMVLVLHDLEGVSPKEISKLVGAPVLTVRTRLFYARKELAAMAARDPMLADYFEEGRPSR